jgi:2Fe-2S ferredoxin
MPTVIFESCDGTRQPVEAETGTTVMRAAIAWGIAGIEADCGGSCSCATCHVYVDERFASLLPAPGADESAMLEFVAAERRTTSRLSCQIVMNREIDHLLVRLPDQQVP